MYHVSLALEYDTIWEVKEQIPMINFPNGCTVLSMRPAANSISYESSWKKDIRSRAIANQSHTQDTRGNTNCIELVMISLYVGFQAWRVIVYLAMLEEERYLSFANTTYNFSNRINYEFRLLKLNMMLTLSSNYLPAIR